GKKAGRSGEKPAAKGKEAADAKVEFTVLTVQKRMVCVWQTGQVARQGPRSSRSGAEAETHCQQRVEPERIAWVLAAARECRGQTARVPRLTRRPHEPETLAAERREREGTGAGAGRG